MEDGDYLMEEANNYTICYKVKDELRCIFKDHESKHDSQPIIMYLPIMSVFVFSFIVPEIQ